ncbi:DNA/RNA helicase [Phyllobacterium brassicacearum]|uniref:DNA/RNA helicase n=2 Tax=Phyllobacterium brassicacearum TaxID=314235 RepID=A0A2P7BQI1_9HYPH|nr:DNA/RNA helicase [Phyllobacterium brassicacearum]
MRRPSTAGVSFAAVGPDGACPSVTVQLAFGMYREIDHEGKSVWRREQHVPDPIPVGLESGSRDVSFSSGEVTGLRVNVRSVPFADGMLATMTLVNDLTPEERNRSAAEQSTLFQVTLEILPDTGTRLIARPSRRAPVDDDDWSSALLYREAREFAAGHTCSADWTLNPDDLEAALAVRTAWIPEATVEAVSPDGDEVFQGIAQDAEDPLSASWLAGSATPDLIAGLQRLTRAYARWITLQEGKISELSAPFVSVAEGHIREARRVLGRMAAGIDFLASSEAACASFRLANLAMATQREWSEHEPLRWRPFQLAFFLLALESAADGTHPDRAVMDLLWFPTGGGKTEAYLGLIAFVAFHRRLSASSPDDGAGVAVIMRYTLRLLTTQQFIRAAAMICACEAIRRGKIATPYAGKLGQEQFSIGLWVGEGATPNSRQMAFDSVTDSSKPTPKQLLHCPCCSERLAYTQAQPIDSVMVRCENSGCILSDQTLPVWTVDEDLYAFRPTLLIGTIDKFAQIVRNAATASLFAVGGPAQPQLIVQDELHLISGPLGTMSGLYESALDLILSANGTKPKIIGSTATIRRASEQVLALFDRTTCQFPPPGLNADNSGFTVVDRILPGRRYLAVSTAGRSAKFTLQAVSASLLQTALAGLGENQRDAYWTLVAYFNSLRELGGALVLMQDDVHDTIRLFANACGEAARALRSVQELTSRVSQAEIRQMLETLKNPAGHDEALDVVLATNMVSVGVDIARLGLMVVNGQPKTMAEYIQATSRVGRSRVPGLVVAVLNNAKPRDRSHFETFRTWHSTIYREVEATSVTPFASRARDRALHAVLVAVVRHLIPQRLRSPVLDDNSIQAAERMIAQIAARARRVDPFEADVEAELKARLQRWIRRSPQQYWSKYPRTSLLQAAELAAAMRAAGRAVGQAWPTPNTMRGVEPATNYRLVEGLRGPDATQ